MTPADISVVIPVLNEEAVVTGSVRSALDAGARDVIVVDGGSADQTVEKATAAGATKIVRSLPGRGIQLNSGATFATGEMILFLHADSRLAADGLQQICELKRVDWGAFRQRIDSPRTIYRWIEWGNAARVRWRRMPFGDQAIFVRRSLFKEQGGVAEIPLMEDVELSRRLRRISRPALLDGPVALSARRWEREGVIRQTIRNWSIQIAFALGISAEKLKTRYR